MNAHNDDELNRLFAPLREFPASSSDSTDRIMAEIAIDSPDSISNAPKVNSGWKGWIGGRGQVVVTILAVSVVLIVVVGGGLWQTSPKDHSTPPTATMSVRPGVVRFVFVSPEAKQVTVAGSFNHWNTDATPLQRVGPEGVWAAEVSLTTGWHSYMFVVDGKQWVADPAAPQDPGTEFGPSNSAVMVIAHNSL